jgi:Skp family chaperone for outer membrane proteins
MDEATTESTKEATAPEAPPAGYIAQADLDRIVKERLERQAAQFKDFPKYKAAAEKLEQLEAAQQTEAERAQAEAQAASEKLTKVEAELRNTRADAAITAAAAKAGIANTSLAVRLLTPDMEYDEEGAITSDIAGLVAALVAENPGLAGKAAPPKAPTPGQETAPDPASLTLEEIGKMDPVALSKNPELMTKVFARLAQG